MKDCPECKAPVDGLRCPQCGYTEPGAALPRHDADSVVARARAAAIHYRAPAMSEIEREAIEKFPSKQMPGKFWAHRLIYRHEHGEHVPRYSLECAYEALGLKLAQDPQENDEPQQEITHEH